MKPILSVAMWVSLPNEVRHRIRMLFKIPRSSNTIVDDGRILTDGTTTEDFAHLTITKMQEYLETDLDDFHKLFDQVVSRVNDDISGKKSEMITANPDAAVTIIIEDSKPKRKYTKKDAKKTS